MTIIAEVFPCGPPSLGGKLCGAVKSHFSVGQEVDHAGHDLLTSATVSEIPSYNDLPDGVGYRAIRGTFLQGSAELLLKH